MNNSNFLNYYHLYQKTYILLYYYFDKEIYNKLNIFLIFKK